MGNIAQKLLQKFLVMSQLGTLLTQGNGNLVQIVLQKAQFSFPIVTNIQKFPACITATFGCCS